MLKFQKASFISILTNINSYWYKSTSALHSRVQWIMKEDRHQVKEGREDMKLHTLHIQEVKGSLGTVGRVRTQHARQRGDRVTLARGASRKE